MKRKRIEVVADWLDLNKPTTIGQLDALPGRGKEIFSFEYDRKWLDTKHAYALDPQLGLYGGVQYPKDTHRNFGIFLDSSPDRWGRQLLQRREAHYARVEKRLPQTLYESDYLLGVYDGHRAGALRFRTEPNGPFLDNNDNYAAPPWSSLRNLQKIALNIEKTDSEEHPHYEKWLTALIAPGSSLGGARPKASIIDEKGRLWLAKFPSNNDVFDIGGWEFVAHQLAIEAGIRMSPAKVLRFSHRHHTFITQRFDRTLQGQRLHFASAMTLVNRIDGDSYATGASYLELVEFIIKAGSTTADDLEELWRRIVFFICISNTDDHLRNHGFLRTDSGWTLAPAYDVNPIASGTGLHLNISETDNNLDIDLALSVIEYFRLPRKRAEKIVKSIRSAVQQWPSIATSLGLAKSEQRAMQNAFR